MLRAEAGRRDDHEHDAQRLHRWADRAGVVVHAVIQPMLAPRFGLGRGRGKTSAARRVGGLEATPGRIFTGVAGHSREGEWQSARSDRSADLDDPYGARTPLSRRIGPARYTARARPTA